MSNTFLTAYERRVLQSLCRALLPQRGTLPSAEEVQLLERFEAAFAGCEKKSQREIRLILLSSELLPLLTKRCKRFSRMSSSERERFLESLDNGEKHRTSAGIYELFKLFLVTFYCASPAVRPQIGYDGQPLREEKELPPESPLHCKSYPEIEGEVSVQADVCVIGSGAGGAVAAATLADHGLRVVVLEEGNYYARAYFRAHETFERMRAMYRNHGLTATLGNTLVALPLGKAVGGTTVVNSGTCFRTPEKRLKFWAEKLGLTAFAPQAMVPYYEEVEEFLQIREVPESVLGNNAKIMQRGCEKLGLRGHPIRRPIGNRCHGSGACVFGCPTDAKHAMHISYLPKAEQSGAEIFSACRAEEIRHENGEAHAVIATILDPESREKRGKLQVQCKAVFCCAGAVYSPLLLKKSKLAPNAHVGKHFRIHPACGALGFFEEDLHAWKGTLQSFYLADFIDQGIILEATYTPPGMGSGTWLYPIGKRLKERIESLPRTAIIGVMASDQSEGRVLHGYPLLSYSLNRKDTRKLIKGLGIAARILLAAGAKKVETLCLPFRDLRNEADIRELEAACPHPSQMHLSAFHPLGSCRMGRNLSTSVTSSEGKVHGSTNVYVADASLFPSSLQVNPQLTINATALRIARSFARTFRSS